MYKYYQLNLFLILIGKFDLKPNFQLFWPKTTSYWGRIRNKHGKNVVLKSWGCIT